MKILLVVLAFPAIFLLLLTTAMVHSARERYQRGQIPRSQLVRELMLSAALWGSLALFGGVLGGGLGLGAKAPFVIVGLGALVGGSVFAALSRGVLWDRP